MRAEIDLLRGDTEAAGQRQQLLSVITAHSGFEDTAWETAQRAAELALWAARAGDALAEVQQVLPLFQAPDPAIMCGRLLAAGMWACADLAEQARARRDEPAAEDAVSAADGLVSWVGQMGGAPFTDHPFVATIPAWRATWEAERARLAGASDPAVWGGAAKAWQDLGCPHRAGYSWWRQSAGAPGRRAAGHGGGRHAAGRRRGRRGPRASDGPSPGALRAGPDPSARTASRPPARARLASPHHMG